MEKVGRNVFAYEICNDKSKVVAEKLSIIKPLAPFQIAHRLNAAKQ